MERPAPKGEEHVRAEVAARVSADRRPAPESEEIVRVEVAPAYPVILCADRDNAASRLVAALVEALPALREGAPLALLTDENVAALHLPRVVAALRAAGLSPHVAVVPPGEEHKSLAQVERLAGLFLAAGLDRGGALLALGGGVVSDLGGFLAAVLLRGLPWAAAPTTLLSQADAAIGGKTAVNLPAGKNLVGAFHHPRLVFADLSTLSTLPEREVASGLGEVVKHALLAGEDELRYLEVHAEAVRDGDPALLLRLLGVSCRMKARIVAADPEERDPAGGRMLLNLGHTVGHALETASAGTATPLRHGEAVALGLLAAARVSAGRLNALSDSPLCRLEGRLRALFGRLRLPVNLDRRLFSLSPGPAPGQGGAAAGRAAPEPDVAAALRLDKKRKGATLRFVALSALGSARVVPLGADELFALLRGQKDGDHPIAMTSEELR